VGGNGGGRRIRLGVVSSVGPNVVPCFNLVLPSLELPAHAFRALESCRHAGEGLPCCLVTSSGTSSAANGLTGEEYQVKAQYQVRANALLSIVASCVADGPLRAYNALVQWAGMAAGEEYD